MKHFLKTTLLVFAFIGTAHATPDHPFVGVFYSGGVDGQPPSYTPEQEKANCALSFSIMKKDGSYTSYLLDKPTFETTGLPRFDIWIAGTCTISDDQKSDVCKTVTNSPGEGAAPPEMSNIYDEIGADRVVVRTFDTSTAAAAALLSSDRNAGDKMHATRCPFTESEIQPYLSKSMTTLNIETWTPLVLPDITPEHLALTAKINAVIATGKK
jgi:hypothetical protein